MDRELIEAAAARLDASGVALFKRERDGSGNVARMDRLSWGAALVQIVALTGWSVSIVDESSTRVLILEPRAGAAS